MAPEPLLLLAPGPPPRRTADVIQADEPFEPIGRPHERAAAVLRQRQHTAVPDAFARNKEADPVARP